MEATLPLSPELLVRAVDTADDGIYITASDGSIVFANEAILRITGYRREELLGRRPSVFKSGAMSTEYYGRLWDTVLSGEVWRELITNRRANGEDYLASQTISPVRDKTGSVTMMIAVQRDLSVQEELQEELRRTQTEVERLLREKETLLEEVYHRVKNDMETTRSLLALEGEQAAHPEAQEALARAAHRAGILSKLYSLLQTGSTKNAVAVPALIAPIIDGLKAQTLPAGTEVVADTETFDIPPRMASAVAILLNELAMNAGKYALTTVAAPQLVVSVTRVSSSGLQLVLSDNGPGFPAEVLTGEKSGFGLELANAFARQFGGAVSLSNAPGAQVTIILPES